MEMETAARDKWRGRTKWAQSLRWRAVFCFQGIRADVVVCVSVCVCVREKGNGVDERIEVLCMGMGACDCA